MLNHRLFQALILALAAFLVVTTAGPSIAAVTHPYRSYIPNQGSPTQRSYRPAAFTLSGDCGSWEQGMRWTTWTHNKAIGHGTHVTANGSCQAVRRRAVVITFTRPRKMCRHYIYTRVHYAFPNHRSLDRTFDPVFGGC